MKNDGKNVSSKTKRGDGGRTGSQRETVKDCSEPFAFLGAKIDENGVGKYITGGMIPQNSPAEIFRSKLKSRYREKGETLPELAQNIRKLTRLAFPSASNDVIEILAIEQFTEAINASDIRLRLREHGPKTMSEIETLAAKLEAHRIADRQRNGTIGFV
ncbi:hypothetical protein CHS0354_025678 [Potamilus streckersoni]|uniref:Uncharacterized protein n=1 Tax=Potamilus streckersoni TaxID=2493646 RepID=A0AAE0S0U0_9BIVA|nr:hypothetical protein CHS0354_025678 [Potamilus streckersoni]